MKKIEILNLLINFIPIILLFLLATYTPEFIKFSQTVLGKAFAVVLIIFYVKIDIILGLFVCALVIFYYQSDYIESFENPLFNNSLKEENKKNMTIISSKETVKVGSTEGLQNLNTAYPLDPIQKITCDDSVTEFRKTHCKKGHLIYKGQTVKPEMAEHVYPEIKQNEYHKCNICDPSCGFEIIEKRINDEMELLTPKRSNDMFEQVWTNMVTTTQLVV